LKCGQSFRWKVWQSQSSSWDTPVYIGVLKRRLLLLTQDESHVFYHCVNQSTNEGIEEDLSDYFQLMVDLPTLYIQWAKNDPIFDKISSDYPGVRMLRQDPLENVFSFICSANNNIVRISSMVEKMCSEYGEMVAELESVKYYSFPSLESLSGLEVEPRLRELGFGYRAKYIQQSAVLILSLGGLPWLDSHRTMSYHQARTSLLQLAGVGPKVADCVLLMSMDQAGAVPVDTHMFNIAKQYLPHLEQHKTVTDKVYLEIGNHFRELYGEYAGWAHSVLFSADLKHLREIKNEGKIDTEIIKNIKVKSEKENLEVEVSEEIAKDKQIEVKTEKIENKKVKSEKENLKVEVSEEIAKYKQIEVKTEKIKNKKVISEKDYLEVESSEEIAKDKQIKVKTEKIEITEFFKTVKPGKPSQKRKNSSVNFSNPVKIEKV